MTPQENQRVGSHFIRRLEEEFATVDQKRLKRAMACVLNLCKNAQPEKDEPISEDFIYIMSLSEIEFLKLTSFILFDAPSNIYAGFVKRFSSIVEKLTFDFYEKCALEVH